MILRQRRRFLLEVIRCLLNGRRWITAAFGLSGISVMQAALRRWDCGHKSQRQEPTRRASAAN